MSRGLIAEVVSRFQDEQKPKKRRRAIQKFRKWYFETQPELSIQHFMVLFFGDSSGTSSHKLGLFNICGRTNSTLDRASTRTSWIKLSSSEIDIGSDAIAAMKLLKSLLDASTHPSYSKLYEVVAGLSLERVGLLKLSDHILSKDRAISSIALSVTDFFARDGHHSAESLLSRSELALETYLAWDDSANGKALKFTGASNSIAPNSITSEKYAPTTWKDVDLNLPIDDLNHASSSNMLSWGLTSRPSVVSLSDDMTVNGKSKLSIHGGLFKSSKSLNSITHEDPLRIVPTNIVTVDTALHTDGIVKAIEVAHSDATNGPLHEDFDTELQYSTIAGQHKRSNSASASTSERKLEPLRQPSPLRRLTMKIGNKFSPRRSSQTPTYSSFSNRDTTSKTETSGEGNDPPQANKKSSVPGHQISPQNRSYVPAKGSVVATEENFDPGLFLCTVHRQTPLTGILSGLQNLMQDDHTRNKQMQRLVRDNIHEFVHCRHTIDQISNLFQSKAGVHKPSIEKTKINNTGLSAIEAVNHHLGLLEGTLQESFVPALRTRKELTNLRRCQEVLRRFEHSLHPAKELHNFLEQGKLTAALNVVRESAPLFLMKNKHPSVLPQHSESSTRIGLQRDDLVQVSCREFESMVIDLADTLYEGMLQPPSWIQTEVNTAVTTSQLSTNEPIEIVQELTNGSKTSLAAHEMKHFKLLVELWDICPKASQVGKFLVSKGKPLEALLENDLKMVDDVFSNVSSSGEKQLLECREEILNDVKQLDGNQSIEGCPLLTKYFGIACGHLNSLFNIIRRFVSRWKIITSISSSITSTQTESIEETVGEFTQRWYAFLCAAAFNQKTMHAQHDASDPTTDGEHLDSNEAYEKGFEQQRQLIDTGIAILQTQRSHLAWFSADLCTKASGLFQPDTPLKHRVEECSGQLTGAANLFIKCMFRDVEDALSALASRFRRALVEAEVPAEGNRLYPALLAWAALVESGKQFHRGVGPDGPRFVVVDWLEQQLVSCITRAALIWGEGQAPRIPGTNPGQAEPQSLTELERAVRAGGGGLPDWGAPVESPRTPQGTWADQRVQPSDASSRARPVTKNNRDSLDMRRFSRNSRDVHRFSHNSRDVHRFSRNSQDVRRFSRASAPVSPTFSVNSRGSGLEDGPAKWLGGCLVALCAVLGQAAAAATAGAGGGLRQREGRAMMHNRASVLFAETCLCWREVQAERLLRVWREAAAWGGPQGEDWRGQLDQVQSRFLRLERALLAQSVDESSAVFKRYLEKGLDTSFEPGSSEPKIRSYTLDILMYLLNTVSEFRCCRSLVGGMTEKFAEALSESLSLAKSGKFGKYSSGQVSMLDLEISFLSRALSLFKSRQADQLLLECHRRIQSLPTRGGGITLLNEQDKKRVVDQMLNKSQLVVNCVNVSPMTDF